ncbi:chromosomal replication initiator protein DnaA [Marvinbryantia formatexigens DSM 14469]|uniref:Chromosomal replication initiator protein DnaA n=1 Tax=Marvinbryantia formatexigens DSM 14469 TaxID=478749 RepID=C6LKK2_9FIRM|nr:chromosomal replication initiator protein DnaA [Marvinbryantia formatexigens]EET58901.1 chromosomal replication initiator protein DnaA [Marvinbryantia formatexigens DSM 14469]UWO26710.1 chromosomal replication initiator protein DnaA [Marvinbryantia formatexigens DSM 14469]SDG88593.1 chromosomal replication initiator protein DnaA [Marvinbryantia formatexigens]
MNIIEENWEEILERVQTEHEMTYVSFDTWLKPLKVYSFENNTVSILVASSQQMYLKYINKKYLLPIKVAIAEVTGLDCNIEFILPEDADRMEADKLDSQKMSVNVDKANLNPRYTFDTFVVGKNNNFAHAASLAVAESPGEIYNPLFIYGGVGLGKTHLMHSIAHFILERNPDTKVLYVTSETFTNEVIENIRSGNNTAMSKFREKYRSIDVLLIDDIQFIIGKESTQEEFFHTFNDLHSSGKQIIISSDKPPKEMSTLEERLKSRFEWGLIADISSPDYETRMAILRKREELDGYHIDDDVIQYIATNIKSNIRELEGALNIVVAFGNLNKRKIDLESAKEALKNIISPDEKRVITPELIINTICEHFHISREDLTGSKRNSEIVFPRQIAMYLCREMTQTQFKEIGKIMGGKDHSTVIHGYDKIAYEVKNNENVKNTINILIKKINP